MNMPDIEKRYAEITGRSISESDEICKDMLNLIMQSLLDGENINIYGFLQIWPEVKRGRTLTGVDGLKYTTPDKRVLKFKCGKAFERKLNGERAHPEDAI